MTIRRPLTIITASLTVAFAGQSFAGIDPNTVVAANNTVFMAGSSALAPDVQLEMQNTICAAGSLTTVTGAGQNAYVCTANATLGLGAVPIAVYYRTSGGSTFGIEPVGNYASHYYPIANGGCPVAGGACTNWSGEAGAAYTTGTPLGGISDVEPALFKAPSPNIDGTAADCNDGNYGDGCPTGTKGFKFTSTSILAQGMGIAVSSGLYTALQAQQATAGVPSLTKAQVRSLFQSGSGLTNAGGAGTEDWGLLSAELTAEGYTGPAFSGAMTVCRRTAGSGTQAALNAIQLGNPCDGTGALTPLSNANDNDPPFLTVTESSSSGGVETCLGAAGVKAIGILSLDQLTKLTAGQKFIAIDGVSPVNATPAIVDAVLESGQYDYFVESTFQIANTAAGNQKTILTNLQSALQKTAPGAGVYNLSTSTGAKRIRVGKNGNTCQFPAF